MSLREPPFKLIFAGGNVEKIVLFSTLLFIVGPT